MFCLKLLDNDDNHEKMGRTSPILGFYNVLSVLANILDIHHFLLRVNNQFPISLTIWNNMQVTQVTYIVLISFILQNYGSSFFSIISSNRDLELGFAVAVTAC